MVTKEPTIRCPANITVFNAPGQCGANVTYPPATATGSPTPVITYSHASGSFFPVGTTTVTATATNICGVASCTFTITVIDNEQPTITCPANIVRNTDPGVCYATIAVPDPVRADNCAVTLLTWVMTGATTGASPTTGINVVGTRQFNLNGTTGSGVTTITYTVGDAAGNTRTCSFTVTVNDLVLPVISGQPANRTVCVGTNATFSVTAAANGGPIAYQWQQWNGTAWVNIAGANASTYTVNNVTLAMNTNTFRVILTGLCSVVTSGAASLYVNALPNVSIQTSRPPQLLPGQKVNLIAVVNPGGGTYQWFKNGVAIPGSTGSGNALLNLTVLDAGTYRVRYTDPNGCINTSADVVVSALQSNLLWVYPNPSDGRFRIQVYNTINENLTLAVYNGLGQQVFTKAIPQGLAYSVNDVDISRMPAGMYVVKLLLNNNAELATKQIVVAR